MCYGYWTLWFYLSLTLPWSLYLPAILWKQNNYAPSSGSLHLLILFPRIFSQILAWLTSSFPAELCWTPCKIWHIYPHYSLAPISICFMTPSLADMLSILIYLPMYCLSPLQENKVFLCFCLPAVSSVFRITQHMNICEWMKEQISAFLFRDLLYIVSFGSLFYI